MTKRKRHRSEESGRPEKGKGKGNGKGREGDGRRDAAEPAVPVYETIEHWYNVHGTGPAVYAGTLCLKGWRPGKQVTEQEYLAAVTAFEKGPMAGTGGTR